MRTLFVFLVLLSSSPDRVLLAQVPGNAGASVGASWTTLTFADSTWSGATELGFRLRLGLWDWVPHRLVSIVPDLQVAATAIGGISKSDEFALSEGEIGVALRVETSRARPYVRLGFPLWRTIEVERPAGEGRERRDYMTPRGDWARPAIEFGLHVPLCRTGAGPEIAYARHRGVVTEVESVHLPPSGAPTYVPTRAINEPYRAARWTLAWSGPFSIARPLPGAFC